MLKVFKNFRVMALCAVVLGLAAAFLAMQKYHEVMSTKHVLIARGDIQLENEIKLDKNVKFDDKSSGGLPDDAIINANEIQGKASKGFIPDGTVIRKAMLKDYEGVGIAGKLRDKPGMLGVSFESDLYTTIGGQLSNGSIVTITALLKPQGGSGVGTSEEIGKDIEILFVDPDGKKGIVAALTADQYKKVTNDNSEGAKFQFALQGRS